MAWVNVVIGLALIEYFFFALAVGRARVRFNVPAPATTGNADFERVYRVQANTLESLIMFVPAMWIFAEYVDPQWAAGLGMLFIIGRALYFVGYSKAANKRSMGFGLALLSVAILLVGGVIGAVRAAI